jgi:methyl-accepting chemotaxis protein
MATLHETVAAIAEQTQHLSQHTGQISSIARLVTDLATQTNMLALNAAVEAVRAGEQGRGFGVVATEIRKLADQSKRSAERIDTLLADIQLAIHATAKTTREGSQTVERGVQIAEKTADALSGVRNAIDEVSLNTEKISFGAQEQANNIQQILSAMNALNQVAQDSAGGIAQVRIGTQNLKESAKQIRQIV